MIIWQSDLFRGLTRDFVKKIMDITTKESLRGGALIYREGDKASHFYVLLTGHVRLSVGGIRQMVYTVSRAGEAFGWSSLVGRNVYSASAECMVLTRLFKIDREDFQSILEREPASGLVLFRNLAGAVGERVIKCHNSFLLAQPSEAHRTYGSTLTLLQRSELSSE